MSKKKQKKEEKQVTETKPMVWIACVNKSGLTSEYSKNAMFGLGWMLGSAGIKAISGTWDEATVSLARNTAVKEFLANEKFSHIYFIDSDQLPSPDAVLRLLSHDEPVVSGWVLSRMQAGLPVVFKIVGKSRPKIEDLLIKPRLFPKWQAYKVTELLSLKKDKKGLVTVDGCGAGSILIKRETFSHLSEPYFYEDSLHKDGFGEDLFFGYNCKLNNIPIKIDLGVFCGHHHWGVIDMRHVKRLIQIEKQQMQQEKLLKRKSPM